MIRLRRGRYYFRYWHRGTLYEKGSYPSKRAALEAEWAHRKTTGATAARSTITPGTITVQDAVVQYLTDTTGTHAPQTRTHVEAALTRFTTYVGAGTLLHTVTAATLTSYRGWRAGHESQRHPGSPVTGATVNRDLTYVSAWLTWCARPPREWITSNPARYVPHFKEPQPTRVYLDDTQREALWKRLEQGHAKFAHDPRYRRERVKAELLYHLGVRRGVVLTLTWEQVDWGNRLLQYHSKGKDRTIPCNERAMELLRELHAGAGEPTGGRVFPEKSDTTFKRLWAKVRTEMGHPTLTRHMLRASFARELVARGVDPITVRELGGWSSLAMVERYVGTPLMAQARAAVDKLDSGGGG